MALTKRNFTTTEQLELEAAPGVWVEDDYASNGLDDRLYAVGDNHYLVQRADQPDEYSEFNTLAAAIKALVEE